MVEVINSFGYLSTGALLLASVVQIALLTLLVGRSRRRRPTRYVPMPQIVPPEDQVDDNQVAPQQQQFTDAQQKAAWKGAMLRRFEGER